MHCVVWHALFFFDGYCSTVQGLLDWFEVDLGFTELLFVQIDLCVLCCMAYVDGGYGLFGAYICDCITPMNKSWQTYA